MQSNSPKPRLETQISFKGHKETVKPLPDIVKKNKRERDTTF